MNIILKNLKPVVLVPGLVGSKLVSTRQISREINKHPKNEFININVSIDKHWADKMMSFDNELDTYDFGGVNGIRNLCEECENLDWYFDRVFRTKLIKNNINYTYYDDIITGLEKNGYSSGVNLVGTPYDFRKIMHPRYLNDLFSKMRILIEKTNDITKKPAVIVAHSIGCLVMYLFLVDYVSKEWKDRYIDKFISIAGPYGGCSISLKTILSGIPYSSFLKERYHSIFQMCSGNILALPNTLSYDKDEVILVDSNKSIEFTVDNYMDILPKVVQDIWFGYIKDKLPLFSKDTEVDTIFVVSTCCETDYKYIYEDIKLDGKTQKEPSDIVKRRGDSVVHKDSLLFHVKKNLMYPSYDLIKLKDEDHSNILKSQKLLDIILGFLEK
jgi:hypothetical protein